MLLFSIVIQYYVLVACIRFYITVYQNYQQSKEAATKKVKRPVFSSGVSPTEDTRSAHHTGGSKNGSALSHTFFFFTLFTIIYFQNTRFQQLLKFAQCILISLHRKK